MTVIFAYSQSRPRAACQVASAMALLERQSEKHSISGDFDLTIKIDVPEGAKPDLVVNEKLFVHQDIVRSQTAQAFKAFH